MSKNDQVWQSWKEWKISLYKWHTFWMAPFEWSNLFFDFDIVLYQEKVTYEKFSHNLILEIQIVWRISAF